MALSIACTASSIWSGVGEVNKCGRAYGAKKPEISMIKSVVLEVKRLKAVSVPRPTVKWRLKTLPV